MANTIISPNRYVQGRGELKNLPEHAKKLGKKLFVIISASGLKRVRDLLEKSFENTGMELVFEEFQGECCETEIKRLGSRFQENKCDLVVGVGGGKIHDSAKAAAYYQGAPVVIIPTIASTDAPCSALSVIYSETGVFERYLFLNSNPDLVLVDTDIIAAAPSRLLVSGMGDAPVSYTHLDVYKRQLLYTTKDSPCKGYRGIRRITSVLELPTTNIFSRFMGSPPKKFFRK